MGLSSGPCLFLARFSRSARREAPGILNDGLVKSCLVSRELLLCQVDFKVLSEGVVAARCIPYALGLVVAVKERKDILRFFVTVFPLGRFVVDAVFGGFVDGGKEGKGLLQESGSVVVWITSVEDVLDGVSGSFRVSTDVLEVCDLNIVVG